MKKPLVLLGIYAAACGLIYFADLYLGPNISEAHERVPPTHEAISLNIGTKSPERTKLFCRTERTGRRCFADVAPKRPDEDASRLAALIVLLGAAAKQQ